MDVLESWLAGAPSAEMGLSTSAGELPAIFLTGFFVLGLGVFSVVCLVSGVPRDPETEKRGASLLVGYFLRHYFFWLVRPLFSFLVAARVPAHVVTVFAAVLGGLAGLLVALGAFAVGGWIFLFAGILDALDGRLARAERAATRTGAVLDSILDRYTDASLVVGLAWYYRGSWALAAALAALVGGTLVPYVRARAEAVGVTLRGGLMQRLERVLLLGGAAATGPIVEAFLPPELRALHPVTAAGLVVVAVTSHATALWRFRELLRTLAGQEDTRPIEGGTDGAVRQARTQEDEHSHESKSSDGTRLRARRGHDRARPGRR